MPRRDLDAARDSFMVLIRQEGLARSMKSRSRSKRVQEGRRKRLRGLAKRRLRVCASVVECEECVAADIHQADTSNGLVIA